MNAKQIIVAAAVVLLALCLVPSVDGASITGTPSTSDSLDFDSNSGGDITFTVDSDTSFVMTVEVLEGDRVITTQEIQIAPIGANEVSVHIGSLSAGNHYLTVQCYSDSETISPDSFHVNVHVNENILSKWSTYAVIAVVVIVIVIFVYLKMRDTPKNKPEMTFEELEAQRKAQMAEKGQKKQKKSAPSTERKKYLGGSKSDAPVEKPVKEKKVKEEKPQMTFEELEAQKQAEKAAKAEKKKQSTGLTERERYLEEKRKKKEEE